MAVSQQTPPHLQGFVDSRHGDVTVVRPMRDYTAKEIAFYNHFFGVPTIITPPLHAKVGEPPVSPLPARLSCGPPSILPLSISPAAPREDQHPPPDGELPAGVAGGFPLHHQHRVPVQHLRAGWLGAGSEVPLLIPSLHLQDR